MNPWVPFVIAFRLSLGGGPPVPEPADPWFSEDKVKHFFASFAATGFAYGAVRAAGLDHGPAEIAAAVGAAAAGIGKELHDRRTGGPISGKDLVWDALGIGAALSLAYHTR